MDRSSRLNYRCFTCIYYLNHDWDLEQDGGALRIYKDSSHFIDPNDAIRNNCEYVDISPKNGVLLIFDSTLVHSVQKVISPTKKRLAFTLWTLRPIDSDLIVGETYDIGQELLPPPPSSSSL